MATVYVGSARIDENGKAYGGKAGDQTGNEVSKQKWYRHSKGWRVFRATDRSIALKIAEAMEAACKNAKIGYDQWQRNSLYAQAERVGFDLSKVGVKCETDCSALVRVCCAYAGIMGIPSDFRTGNMPGNLLKTGAFVELKGGKYTDQSTYLGRGDILVTRTSGHTVVVLDDGAKYEGDPVEKEYTLGERILRNGDEGRDVEQLQEYLVRLGYDLGDFGENNDGIDGDYGDTTELRVEQFQRKHGLDADGEYGPISHEAMLKAIADVDNKTAIAPMQIRIVDGDCYIRAAPNTSGKKLGVAKKGSVWPYQGEVSAAGWHLIEYQGQNGWVSGKYSKVGDFR